MTGSDDVSVSGKTSLSWLCCYSNDCQLPRLRTPFEGSDIFPPMSFSCFFFSLSPPASTVLKGLPAAYLLWEQNPVKGPSRHKMAYDSPTQSLLCYTHIFTHIQEHCQLHTGHSGKSQLREQPLCVWERWSFLKRFTAVWNSRPLSLLITTPWTC